MLVIALVVLSAVSLGLIFLLLPGESTMEQRAPFWGVNYAHRGLHNRTATIPENSLAAFAAAANKGYGIELDIQITKDDEVVVFHDDNFARLCGVDKDVSSMSLEEIATLRLLKTNEGVPLLRDVLNLVNSRVPLIIELKSCPRYTQLCQLAWRVLRRYDGDFCVESFDPRIVRWWKRKVPGILRGQLASPGGSIRKKAINSLFANFLARPQFIAYKFGPKPLAVRVVERFAMRVTWTVDDASNAKAAEHENDAVIFEFYDAEPKYMSIPEMPFNSKD